MLYSCLEGLLGRAWADKLPAPRSAQIVVGDFSFFAGAPDESLAGNIPAGRAAPLLMIAREDGWRRLFPTLHPGGWFATRYAFYKTADGFDRGKLSRFAQMLPPGYRLQRINEPLYQKILLQSWCRDFCSLFRDWEQFQAHGLGIAAMRGEEICAGASSYSFYSKGIEIEVDTKEGHRQKGLARACCAKLILDCLVRGLYPSWDAANLVSVHLAETLGYRLREPYQAYFAPVR